MTDKEILANAPEGATHIDINGLYLRYDLNKVLELYHVNYKKWHQASRLICPDKSLSDIKRIVELEQKINNLNRSLNDQARLLECYANEYQARKLRSQARKFRS